MEAWKQRVVEERDALKEKRQKLSDFLHSDAFDKLEPLQKDLLRQQLYVMCAYENTLDMRIGFFEPGISFNEPNEFLAG